MILGSATNVSNAAMKTEPPNRKQMRRLLITSPSFSGEAEAVYDQTGRLIRFDVSKTSMPKSIIRVFKEKIPPDISEIELAFKGTHATVVEADFEVSLDDFKREYPYSRNYHLLDALWPKMKKTEQVEAYFAAIEYRKYCERNTSWYKSQIAATWLNKKEFKNDWKKM